MRVAPGAVLENCIVMQDTVIGEGAALKHIISDKNVEIAPYVMYVNANTYITSKMETILYTDDGQEFLYVAYPGNFEKRSGVLMPTITKTVIGEDRHEVVLLKEFELNVTFSEDVFQVPEGKIPIGRKKQQTEE